MHIAKHIASAGVLGAGFLDKRFWFTCRVCHTNNQT